MMTACAPVVGLPVVVYVSHGQTGSIMNSFHPPTLVFPFMSKGIENVNNALGSISLNTWLSSSCPENIGQKKNIFEIR